MFKIAQMALSVVVIAATAGAASAAPKHGTSKDAAGAYNLYSGNGSAHVMESGAEAIQSRGNAEADGLQYRSFN
jgi:hypothetical protein